jgi:hypothetical protein
MCMCGYDPLTPFCESPGCYRPEDEDEAAMAISDFLTTARLCAIHGTMSFEKFMDIVVEFGHG